MTVVIVCTVATCFGVALVAFPVVFGYIGAVVALVIVHAVHIVVTFVVGTGNVVP